MLKKEKLLFNNQDKKIKILLSNTSQGYGEDQEIDGFVDVEVEKSINPAVDEEVTRFRFSKSIQEDYGVLFNMNFYDYNKDEYSVRYLYAGFTEEEILNYALNFRNSFFILEIFDTKEENKRKKIATNYYTKLWNFNVPEEEQEYIDINKTNQIRFINIPNKHLENNDGETFVLYLRVLFYNGKTGNIIPFYKGDEHGIDDEKTLFFTTTFDYVNRVWECDNLYGYEVTDQPDYSDKLNETNKNATDLRVNYPTKELFDYKTGTYKNQEDVE